MRKIDFYEAVVQIVRKDSRYAPEAYGFLREALDFTMKTLGKPKRGAARHVSGRELLEGSRKYALQQYGPMAMTVLNTWGITQGEDFGQIVFNLVHKGVLGKSDQDALEDFAGGYDFRTAFRAPFEPEKAAAEARRPDLAPRAKD
jgi:uncharacterized repeat protein (TIGR04138 family)